MIAVITPSLPTRTRLLAEACESVANQTLPPDLHLIGVDHRREGSASIRNRLAQAAVGCDWLAFLDDDDLLYPGHLSLLHLVAKITVADLVYPYCDVEGRDGWNPSRPFDPQDLRQGNYIPVTVLVRRDTFLRVGGFRDSSQVAHGWEDWDLWLRLLDAGARFECAPTPTWVYRFQPEAKTWMGENQAA